MWAETMTMRIRLWMTLVCGIFMGVAVGVLGGMIRDVVFHRGAISETVA
ncbi:MAG: TRIC cation channel family protein [Lentisphaerae bacterium]|nr:TRIC cation channel family protein [Lentisphaerota bacterium]